MTDLSNSLWCADGEMCKIPDNKKGIDWGFGVVKFMMMGIL